MIHKLEADSILLDFGTRKILSNVYLICETGKVTGILGRNGSGKTCLMNIIYGSLPTIDKSIRFDDVPVICPFKHPKLLVYLPQFNFIPPSLIVKRIFADFELDYTAFEKFFPEFKAGYKVSFANLSGGQRRLIETYIIIKAKSQFAMLNEPFSHLMPILVEKLKKMISEEKDKKGFLITDHLFRHVTDICDNLYIVKDGKTHLVKDKTDIERLGYARL
jgi:ABC-type multidrug transport system ATPase subunit